MLPAPLSLAKSDPRLRGAALAVYVWCLEHLDTMQFRGVKILEVSIGCRVKRNTACDALARLCAAGYIERGARGFREPWSYRLLASPRTVKTRAA